MATGVCSVCGERNPPGTEFCLYCQNYLGWDKTGTVISTAGGASSGGASSDTGSGEFDDQEMLRTQLAPRVRPGETTASAAAAGSGKPAEPDEPDDLVAEDRFRVTVESPAVTAMPFGGPVDLEVRVANISIRVDGYVGEAPEAPEWLSVTSSPVELLPGTDEVLRIRYQVVSSKLVPAQQLSVPLRIRAMNSPLAVVEFRVAVTVGVVDAPLQLRAEPRLLRVADRADAAFTLTLDNTQSNREVRAELAGSDPELAVRFRFEPPVAVVPPVATASVRVTVSAEQPPPGQEASRPLTVTARDGNRAIETLVTFLQSTSLRVDDPVVGLQLEPAVIRVRDNPVGLTRLTVDNRNGRDWAHVELRASDPEQVVSVGFESPQLHVPPGQTAQTQVRLHAALPELGSEATRTVTVTATDAKRRTATAMATYVQVTSASPMTTLGVRLEPEITRVHDADGATVQVVLDNRKGRFRVRLQLSGSDPERAVGFAFSPPVVDVEAGMVRTIELRVGAWRPPPGQEWSRQITVSASDGHTSVEGRGSLVQSSSRSAMETLTMRLDPSVLRLDGRRGVLSALVDNRNSAQPARVTLSGDDPENVIRFTFAPAVMEVPPGGVVRSEVRVDAPRAPSGRELTRSFMITATDGRAEIQGSGTLLQRAGDWRPVARILFTLFGALLMVVGTMLPWLAGTDVDGFDMTAREFARLFGFDLQISERLDPFTSTGAVVLVFAALVAFGLTGRSGRLTRWAAFGAAVAVVATYVTPMFALQMLVPSWGPIVVLAGCVLAYIGGLVHRR